MAWPKPGELVRSLSVHVETAGSGPRVVLVHGCGGNERTGPRSGLWSSGTRSSCLPVRLSAEPAASRGSISRSRPRSLRRILEPGDHLVGHSYGGVISLLAAERADLRSLTVLEPPAFGVARGHPAVDGLIAELSPLWPTELPPEEFLRAFIETVGAESTPLRPLPPEVEASVRAMMVERAPWEAEIPLDALAAAPFPEARRLGRASTPRSTPSATSSRNASAPSAPSLPASGHSLPRAPGFNDVLLDFLARA